MGLTLLSRQLIGSVVTLTLFIALYHLCTTTQWAFNHVQSNLIVTSYLQHGETIRIQSVKHIDHAIAANVFKTHQKPSTNNHIELLTKCDKKSNPVTNAIRIRRPINNITLIPQGSSHDSSLEYFNPTLIPLPAYSPYPYLLLSRLVTAGLHQESHICLASLCVPRNHTISQALPTGAHYCDDSAFQVLGSQGGIRCATTPERLNIPPTPAYRCQGVWSAFPDIPGFHDPRVFWSGKGEPLVMVNSASRYACVGLWVVDLRAIYSELEQLMERKGKYASLGTQGEITAMQSPVRMSYPHLTELTRNPRDSRGVVEKNWIMFFPKADESWVQYDLVAHGGHHKNNNGSRHHVHETFNPATDGRVNVNASGSARNDTMAANRFDSAIEIKDAEPAISTLAAAAPTTNTNRTVLTGATDTQKQFGRSAASYHNPILAPSRTFAKLIGFGYTTSNLTASDEAPCLSSGDLLDNTGKEGHWHQGSNSLRLILCSRIDVSCTRNDNESALVEDGRVVHFAILHRKFSNDLDLPMRYERYVMVWEARYPFRMVGITRHPILFAGEKAQPWSDDDNDLKGDEEAVRWKGAYFTYTPSLAWSWRKESVMDSMGSERVGLGTGFLGDEVIVGVGMDDVAQGFVSVKVEELLSCLRLCPDFVRSGEE